MEFFRQLIYNDALFCAIVAWMIAQFLKIFSYLWSEHKWDIKRMFSSGGMPSSHSSTVCALMTRCAMVAGADSPAFAVCFVLAAVVMYDATGVRRAAGEQARVLNHIVGDLFSGNPEYSQKALKELIGHTPLQVGMGALLGVLIGLFLPTPGMLS